MGNGCINSVIGSLIGGLIGLAVGIGFSFLCANSESMISAGEAGYGLESLKCLQFPFYLTIIGWVIGLVIGFGWSPPSNAKKPATLICNKCNHTNSKSWKWQHCTNCGNSLKNARAYSNSKYNSQNTIIQCLTFILITIVVATILLYFYQFIPE
tara:strand:- start:924 stop:1385 length:462 start_codon:yes stop_codon:yes gene_type:complete